MVRGPNSEALTSNTGGLSFNLKAFDAWGCSPRWGVTPQRKLEDIGGQSLPNTKNYENVSTQINFFLRFWLFLNVYFFLRKNPFFKIYSLGWNGGILYTQNGWILSTSETHGVETEYSRELTIKFKIVHKIISDIFYFDQNSVQCHWK